MALKIDVSIRVREFMIRDVNMYVTANKYVVLYDDVTETGWMWNGEKFTARSNNNAVTNRNVRTLNQVGMWTDF